MEYFTPKLTTQEVAELEALGKKQTKRQLAAADAAYAKLAEPDPEEFGFTVGNTSMLGKMLNGLTVNGASALPSFAGPMIVAERPAAGPKARSLTHEEKLAVVAASKAKAAKINPKLGGKFDDMKADQLTCKADIAANKCTLKERLAAFKAKRSK